MSIEALMSAARAAGYAMAPAEEYLVEPAHMLPRIGPAPATAEVDAVEACQLASPVSHALTLRSSHPPQNWLLLEWSVMREWLGSWRTSRATTA